MKPELKAPRAKAAAASAETNCGKLRITFDRGYFLEGGCEWSGPPMDDLSQALEHQKRLRSK